MQGQTIGIIIIIISALGYVSNYLNWHFLNYKINHWLYYLGAFVHETSHDLLCLMTGARVSQYKVITSQPRVVYSNSKLPILGNFLISIAPILGGLAFLFFVNKYFLTNQFSMPAFSDWKFFLSDFWKFFNQINLLEWKDWVAIFLFLNMGAMIGPSWQDLKNVWVLVVILIFVPWPFFAHLGLLASAFILMGIIVQAILIAVVYILNLFNSRS
jgi:hypothetical protein